ncbi:hypothetical protein HK097_006016 [Rhizophlyctis rosea]|uniref:Uncharacterized protein n=1 Tax=Rhizophlyctis rosea TaxID=64517 RepID=A0AAD5X294_9FUNG|nr:hypothetical protein HK097_006016 [Rhizophlyctis rosea]
MERTPQNQTTNWRNVSLTSRKKVAVVLTKHLFTNIKNLTTIPDVAPQSQPQPTANELPSPAPKRPKGQHRNRRSQEARARKLAKDQIRFRNKDARREKEAQMKKMEADFKRYQLLYGELPPEDQESVAEPADNHVSESCESDREVKLVEDHESEANNGHHEPEADGVKRENDGVELAAVKTEETNPVDHCAVQGETVAVKFEKEDVLEALKRDYRVVGSDRSELVRELLDDYPIIKYEPVEE